MGSLPMFSVYTEGGAVQLLWRTWPACAGAGVCTVLTVSCSAATLLAQGVTESRWLHSCSFRSSAGSEGPSPKAICHTDYK